MTPSVKRTYSAPQWQFIPNPAFDINFRCPIDSAFESCVSANAAKFEKGSWKFSGSKCETYSYWQGQCEKYETFSSTRNWPVTSTRNRTTVNVYKFEENEFSKLDDPSSSADDLAINGSPLEHKSFNFQNGFLYSVMSNESNNNLSTDVSSFKILPNAFVPGGKLSEIAPGESLKSVLFSGSNLYFVTFRQVDPLFAVDLKVPGKPVLAGELKVPGYSRQLIADGNSLLGIGRIDLPQVSNFGSLWKPKLSLYDISNISSLREIQTDILAKDVSYAFSEAESDDQSYHYNSQEKTIFVPVQGWNWNPPQDICEVTSSNLASLAISSILPSGLATVELQMPEFIDRTLMYAADSAVAFGLKSVNFIKREKNQWKSENLHLGTTTEGIYRIAGSDQIIAVRVKRAEGRIVEMKLHLGKRSEIENGTSSEVLDVPMQLLSCYGQPSFRFFGKKAVLMFEKMIWSNSTTKVSRHEFGFKFDNGKLEALDPLQSKELADRKIQLCQVPEKWLENDVKGLSLKDLLDDYSSKKLSCQAQAVQDVYSFTTLRCLRNQVCGSL